MAEQEADQAEAIVKRKNKHVARFMMMNGRL
jgi:hypothetical protein